MLPEAAYLTSPRRPMPFPWTLHGDGRTIPASDIVLPEERLSWPRTIGLGA